MKPIKIMTVIGTRPEIIRLSSVIKLFDSQYAVEHILVHTGQNYDYELNEIFFDDLNLRKPDYFLNSAKETPIQTIADALVSLEPVLIKENPDAFLVLGDTNSALTAIVAKKHKIPIFHMEAGNRCFDERVPEETNRKIVDHIADINLPYSSIAREYLLKEGIPADRIIKTGSPMFEVIQENHHRIKNSNVLSKLALEKGKYFLVSSHREENVDNPTNLKRFLDSLEILWKTYKLPILLSTHPRTLKKINLLDIGITKNIILHKPFSFTDYCALQVNAKVVLSDSGTLNEEAATLKFKAINLRESHERPEAMEVGQSILTGYHYKRILQAIEVLSKQHLPNTIKDYSISNVSSIILSTILSYTDYVHHNVYQKENEDSNE